jgi:hypothetical protein
MSLSNGALLRIIEEMRAELEFIKSELHINTTGPCSGCDRKWFVASSSRGHSSCSICGITLCPTCIRVQCNECKNRCCDDHFKDGYCTDCINKKVNKNL